MQRWKIMRVAACLGSGAVLLQFGGCLGPNPGFFISTSIANATILNLVQRVLNSVLGAPI